jgi:uncharacterized protein YjdB
MLTGLGVTPALARAGIGTIVSFQAIGRFSDGSTRDLTAQATWSSSAPGIATVAGGQASARAAGSTTITASALGASATAVLTVTGASLTGLTIDPIDSAVPVGMRSVLRATGLYSDGSKQDLTGQVTWTSTDPAIATVSGGVVTGVRAGAVTITATWQMLGAKASVRVTGARIVGLEVFPPVPTLPLPGTLQFSAIARFDDGSRSDATRLVTWESSDRSVLTISAEGFATSVRAGTSVVRATVGNLSAGTVATVSRARLIGIRVTPAIASVPSGITQAFQATGGFADGTTADLTASVAWSSSEEKIASVSNAPGSQGLATGFSAGTVTILATLSGVTGQARLTVTDAKATGLTLAPPVVTLAVGSRQPVRASATFSDGSVRDVTDATSWSVADPAVAGVSNAFGSAGLVTGVGVGGTVVTGNYQGLVASGRVRVTGATLGSIEIRPAMLSLTSGQRQGVTAWGQYSDGTSLDLTSQVTWSTDNPIVATVSNAPGTSGLVIALGEGTTTLVAQLGSVGGKAVVVVTALTVDQLSISPPVASQRVGQSMLFGATALRSNGTSQNVTLLSSWTSSNPMVASLGGGPLGASRATCNSVGTVTITATYMGLSDSVVLTCTEMRTLVELQVTPFAASMIIGQLQPFVATAIYSDGSTQNVTGMTTWSSSSPMVADVRNMGGMGGRGTVTALSAGTATITGSYMGMSASGFVTVSDAKLTGISVSPPALALRVGETQGLQAIALYSDGSTRNVTGMAVWTSSDQTVADVTNTAMGGGRGRVTALAAGSVTITATFMGFEGTSSVRVSEPTLTEIQVTPTNPTIPLNLVQPLQATAIYSDFSRRNVTGLAGWSSSDPAVAPVSNAGGSRGQVTGLAPGTSVISATFMGVTGTTTVTVTKATVTQVQIDPVNPTSPVGVTIAFTAVAVLSDNTSRDVTGMATWTSSTDTVAAISNTPGSRGLATALAPGATRIVASVGGVSGATAYTVGAQTLSSIAVDPAMETLSVGDAVSLTATGNYSDGSTYDLTAHATWISSAPGVAAVSNAAGSVGLVTALGGGTTTVNAHFQGRTGTASITVTP